VCKSYAFTWIPFDMETKNRSDMGSRVYFHSFSIPAPFIFKKKKKKKKQEINEGAVCIFGKFNQWCGGKYQTRSKAVLWLLLLLLHHLLLLLKPQAKLSIFLSTLAFEVLFVPLHPVLAFDGWGVVSSRDPASVFLEGFFVIRRGTEVVVGFELCPFG
jgi:hypothetical protein